MPDGGQDHRERLLQELLDGTLTGERREAAMVELRADPAWAAELVRLRTALDAMRSGGDGVPDFAPAILDEIGRRRGFVARSMRRVGTAARIAAVVCVLGTVGALAMVRERSEGVLAPARPAPVSQVVSAVEREVGGCMRTLGDEARELGGEMGEMPEAARILVRRLANAPKPLVVEPERDATLAMLTWEIEPSEAVVSGGRVGSMEAYDLSVRFDDATRAAESAGRQVFVVGSGSHWVGVQRPWPVVHVGPRPERKSSFGLGRDAGYP